MERVETEITLLLASIQDCVREKVKERVKLQNETIEIIYNKIKSDITDLYFIKENTIPIKTGTTENSTNTITYGLSKR